MVIEVMLPKIGMAMQDAIITKIYSNMEDHIKKDDPLFDIETEKVTETIRSPVNGVVQKIFFKEGDIVEIGEVICNIFTIGGNAGAIEENEIDFSPSTPKSSVDDKKEFDNFSLADEKLEMGTAQPLSRIRNIISKKMKESLHITAQFTMMKEVDVSSMVELRENCLKIRGITYTDIFIYLVVREIEKFPLMNSRIEDDRLIINPDINIGFAVAVKDGLIVPVIKKANDKALNEISVERRRLISAVRKGSIISDDLSEGTFTVSNLGNYGVEFFTPIINLPEVAILGFGEIALKPVVIDNQIKIRSMLGISLTVDHRVIDGAPGAEFLESVSKALNQSELL